MTLTPLYLAVYKNVISLLKTVLLEQLRNYTLNLFCIFPKQHIKIH